VSTYPTDTDNNGLAWTTKVRVSVPGLNKDYYAGGSMNYTTDLLAESADSTQTFKLYLPIHADVYMWVQDSLPADNRGVENFEIKQISGPNDSLPVRIRDAMTRSVLWEQQDVAAWNGDGGASWIEKPNYQCFACHVQTQASVGLQVSKNKLPELPVDMNLQDKFVDAYKNWQDPVYGWVSPFHFGRLVISQTSLWAWAVSLFNGARFDQLSGNLMTALDWLVQQNPEGGWNDDHGVTKIFGDGIPSATHTSGNIQALAKALDYIVGKDIVPLPNQNDIIVSENMVSSQKNIIGLDFTSTFDPISNVTAIRIIILDSFDSISGSFYIKEVKTFLSSEQKQIHSAITNKEYGNYVISNSIDGDRVGSLLGLTLKITLLVEYLFTINRLASIDYK
jgi:hypothetical protein